MIGKGLQLLALLGFASAAQADMVFTLDQGSCCGAPPFGTITLKLIDANTIQVTELLTSGDVFANSAGEALAFNVDKSYTLVPGSISSPFVLHQSTTTTPPFGSFSSFIDCPASACGNGTSGNITGPLAFQITSATGLAFSDFVGNTGGFFFATDIGTPNGNGGFNTGNVAAGPGVVGAPPPATPEPSTVLLLGTGAVGFLWLKRRRASML